VKDDRPVASLRNLGPASARMLAEAGIRTVAELRTIGPAKAYARVRAIHSKGASLNLLWSLAAGLDDRGWQEVTPEEKKTLEAAYRKLRR
jgi:DNA transformation protein and related proteins